MLPRPHINDYHQCPILKPMASAAAWFGLGPAATPAQTSLEGVNWAISWAIVVGCGIELEHVNIFSRSFAYLVFTADCFGFWHFHDGPLWSLMACPPMKQTSARSCEPSTTVWVMRNFLLGLEVVPSQHLQLRRALKATADNGMLL